jgi:hypothetical protein
VRTELQRLKNEKYCVERKLLQKSAGKVTFSSEIVTENGKFPEYY